MGEIIYSTIGKINCLSLIIFERKDKITISKRICLFLAL